MKPKHGTKNEFPATIWQPQTTRQTSCWNTAPANNGWLTSLLARNASTIGPGTVSLGGLQAAGLTYPQAWSLHMHDITWHIYQADKQLQSQNVPAVPPAVLAGSQWTKPSVSKLGLSTAIVRGCCTSLNFKGECSLGPGKLPHSSQLPSQCLNKNEACHHGSTADKWQTCSCHMYKRSTCQHQWGIPFHHKPAKTKVCVKRIYHHKFDATQHTSWACTSCPYTIGTKSSILSQTEHAPESIDMPP